MASYVRTVVLLLDYVKITFPTLIAVVPFITVCLPPLIRSAASGRVKLV